MHPATARRHLRRLTHHWPTRRQLTRCGRLVQPPPDLVAEDDPPIAAAAADTPAPPSLMLCAICGGADFYHIRTRPGVYRCRDCGEETRGDPDA